MKTEKERTICPNCQQLALTERSDGFCSQWCYFETIEKSVVKPVVEKKLKRKRRKRNSQGELE